MVVVSNAVHQPIKEAIMSRIREDGSNFQQNYTDTTGYAVTSWIEPSPCLNLCLPGVSSNFKTPGRSMRLKYSKVTKHCFQIGHRTAYQMARAIMTSLTAPSTHTTRSTPGSRQTRTRIWSSHRRCRSTPSSRTVPSASPRRGRVLPRWVRSPSRRTAGSSSHW